MLETLVVNPQRFQGLTVFPVISTEAVSLPYLLTSEALAAEILYLEPKENSDTSLLALNRGPNPILVLNGEQLNGADSGFMTGQSVLLRAEGVTELTVTPLDHGGWQFEDISLGRHRDPRTPRPSNTELAHLREHPGAQVAEWFEAFPILANQVGVLAFLGKDLLGFDVLGAPNLFASLHRRLLAGYILAALARENERSEEAEASNLESGPDADRAPRDETPPDAHADSEDASEFVDGLEEAERIPVMTQGLGAYSVLRGRLVGGELLHEGHLVHLSVFPGEGRM